MWVKKEHPREANSSRSAGLTVLRVWVFHHLWYIKDFNNSEKSHTHVTYDRKPVLNDHDLRPSGSTALENRHNCIRYNKISKRCMLLSEPEHLPFFNLPHSSKPFSKEETSIFNLILIFSIIAICLTSYLPSLCPLFLTSLPHSSFLSLLFLSRPSSAILLHLIKEPMFRRWGIFIHSPI